MIEYELAERMKVECPVWKNALPCKVKPSSKRWQGLVACYLNTPEPKPAVEEVKVPEKLDKTPTKSGSKCKGKPKVVSFAGRKPAVTDGVSDGSSVHVHVEDAVPTPQPAAADPEPVQSPQEHLTEGQVSQVRDIIMVELGAVIKPVVALKLLQQKN